MTLNSARASYVAEYLTAHTAGETPVNPAALAKSQAMWIGELLTIPMLNKTVTRRYHNMAKDIKSQLFDSFQNKYIEECV